MRSLIQPPVHVCVRDRHQPQGVAPTNADVLAAAAGESHDQAAVTLGAVLADPEVAGAILEALERHIVGNGASAMALARRRLALGRLMTVVG